MLVPWLWVAPLVALCSAGSGSSLRGAVEALQRRQRGHVRGPIIPSTDYDALYEFIPPGYPETDYVDDVDIEAEPNPKYIVKLLEENERSPETYEYKVIKKKSSRYDAGLRKDSAFRERSHHADNDRLRDLFADRSNEDERKNEILQEKGENDAEYALLLNQLWSKYKNNKIHSSPEPAPQGVVNLYKEKIVKKRYPDNWGPIAFKRKRSSDSDGVHPIPQDYDADRNTGTPVSNHNTYDLSDDDKDDWREEYSIAFQPLEDDSLTNLSDDDQYSYDPVEKRFPVTKRSSGSYEFNNQKKRFVQNQKTYKTKSFRSSAGTDPRIIKDLSKIFGDMEIKNPVKRNAEQEESHESKPPKLPMSTSNTSYERNNAGKHGEDSHEHHGHMHPPGIAGKESDHAHDHVHNYDHDHNHDNHEHKHDHDNAHHEKPKLIRKKSIDWSDYFGIDKRSKKFVNDANQDRLRKQYFDTFNKEVIYPVNSFRKHSFVKRNYVEPQPNERTEMQSDGQQIERHTEEKRDTAQDNDAKLDNIDKKLRNMEGMLVDDALRYSEVDEELDSKEEQEMKEKLLSRLAAAYSLEKMRKALKEFKQSLQTQRTESSSESSSNPSDEAKAKRVSVKKEKVDISNEIPMFKGDKLDDFEEEQGAGHYLNGKTEQQFSEGYMVGSGRHRVPVVSTAGEGPCPVLAKIVQRCRGVDLLAGDRGQLFLPLCSLHQICYLCGEAPPTTCDLVFLSEADTTCEGDMGCQRAARSALMALRELHDNLADELDGECEASPCLSATLKLNTGWQRALQR